MPNVLFLDDEEAILNTYRRIVRPMGIEGFYAKDSKQAQMVLDTHKIDLIISDYRLEQETGLDFLRTVRIKDKKIPMIIISGYAEENFVNNARELDIIQDYLIKPVSLEGIKNLLGRYLTRENL